MMFTFCIPTYWKVTGLVHDQIVVKVGSDTGQLFSGRVLSFDHQPLPAPYTDADGDLITGELRFTVEVDEAMKAPWLTS